MLSRENRVQLAAMAVALFVLISFATVVPSDPGPGWLTAFALVFYGVAFGGAHLYHYLRGEGGAVPHSARGRFLLTVGIVVPLWAAAIFWQGTAVSGIDIPLLMGLLSVVVFVVYFLYEMRLGYHDFATSESR